MKAEEMYQPVIGLEVHIELTTKSKMFCRCSADHFSKKANTLTCPICLGLPGAMPHVNNKAVKYVVLFGLSFNCDIRKISKFDRKHYFYPDLPKGYQISQYDKPLCEKGYWISKLNKKYRIKRIHIEEDTGKLIHQNIKSNSYTLVDFNRSGVPLMELVTEPDFNNSTDVLEFLKDIQALARYLKISNADMEKGSMRLEANISVRKTGTKQLPNYKVELKNINSFKFLQKAIDIEISRQIDLLKNGKRIQQQTRGYDEKRNITFLQRSKEEAKDYRYFPEPDINKIFISDSLLNKIKRNLVESPWDKRNRFIKKLNINENYADILVRDKERSDYFEELLKLSRLHSIDKNTVLNLMINKNFDSKFKEPQLFILEILKINRGFKLDDKITDQAINDVIKNEENAINDYKKGKTQVIGYLIGMVQKKLDGRGNINLIKDKLLERLNN